MRDKVRLILVALGVLCLANAALVGWVLCSYKTAVGVVDSVDEHHISFAYTRFNGTGWGYTIESPHTIPHYKVGDSVNILYDPHGKTAVLSGRDWSVLLTLGSVGVLLVSAGLFAIRKTPRSMKRGISTADGRE